MVAQDGVVEPPAIGKWSKTFEELHRRIGHRFARSEARERARRYLAGLLGRVERKNGWQLAEAIGERDPQGVQRLLNAAKWDADAVRNDLREHVAEHLGDEESGVLIVDETGFSKKGNKSVGVARQYTGTAGDTVNCQVGVFLAYSSEKGAAFLDRALYLPRAWTGDPVRRAEARIPKEIGDRLPQQDRAGRGDAREGLRGRCARPVGARGLVLREVPRFQDVAGGADSSLRRDGPEDQRCAAGRTQEEDREACPAAARRHLLGGATRCSRCQR